MRLKDCKVGMLVLATKKSICSGWWKEFLLSNPCGVGRIAKITGDEDSGIIVSVGRVGAYFVFSPEDLVSLE